MSDTPIYTLGIDIGSTTSKCVILKDGAEIAAQVTEREAGALKAPIVRVGTPNTYIPVGMVEWQIVPDKMDVIRAVKKTLGRELLEEEKGQVEVDGVAELKKSRPKTDVD